jgi:hypothetical protein
VQDGLLAQGKDGSFIGSILTSEGFDRRRFRDRSMKKSADLSIGIALVECRIGFR